MSVFRRRPTLLELLEQRCAERATPKPVHRTYRCQIRRWERIIGALPVDRISREHVRQFRRGSIDAGRALITTNGDIRTVLRMLRYAQDLGLVRSIPIV